MAGIPEASSTDTGLCRFGMQRLPPLLEAFEKEIDGVRAAGDIEYIHRMRVASRRLRAALPLFKPCFPQKQYARWMKEITSITRALGEARDADVQIAFLVRSCKKSNAAWKARPGAAGTNPVEPAVAFLGKDLQKKRRQLQVHVLSALAALEKSGIVSDMRTTFASRLADGRRIPVQAMAFGVPTVAALRIESRLEDMRAFEPWVEHADAVAEHHAMRIAAKKLRYTMEVYAPVYRLGLQKPISRVKKVQEILGDIHDCDVWIDTVTRLLLRERGRFRSQDAKTQPDTATLASLRLFLQERERERVQLHRRFMRYWESLTRAGTWDGLRQTFVSGRMTRYIPVKKYRDDELRLACEARAAIYPAGLAHHRTVTRLALMIFDGLQPLHRMSPHDRVLLGCAGMLHDIGWLHGAQRHNARSARMIFADESLPLDFADRITTGLVALAHRGRVRIESHPLFTLLPSGAQVTILQLAAILRIADGLDLIHAGSVEEVRCTIGDRQVTCEVISQTDVTQERERAQSRSDLFVRVYGREVVIT
ncbi:MAG: CHAD domain-containing protein [Methanoregula sp.]|jgi:CHAD domain-containing protein|uniref:CHAD domain-containing protein n=1 Tax=Methanoregula sp. TaxID=2052170 RepID=UPI0025E02B35|nr:CHAD domain-containing protein [Methanoregula sp.]MCK9632046.1 CHAD domain-containing protein [Methanoregula sp.]